MVYTCETVPALMLKSYGTVLDVVPPGELRAAARAVAAKIAAKDPEIIRLAKQSLNGIEPVDMRRSYRYEQGFTFELNLIGISDQARQAFDDEPERPQGDGRRRRPGRAAGRDDDRGPRAGPVRPG